jgi:hypothetical protein
MIKIEEKDTIVNGDLMQGTLPTPKYGTEFYAMKTATE